MKKSLILFIIAGICEATITRINTLGENREILIDEANVFYYPTQIYFLKNLVSLEIIDTPYLFSSIKINKGNILVLSTGRIDSIFYEMPYNHRLPKPSQLEIFYTGVTRRISIGFGLGIGRKYREMKNYYSEKTEIFSFKGGFLHCYENKIFEMGINFNSPLYEMESYKIDGDEIKLKIRSFLPYKSLNFIPFISFSHINIEEKYETLNTFKRLWIKSGLGLFYQFEEIHKVYFSWELNYREKYEEILEKEYSLTSFSFGVESNPFKWLILRLGIRKYDGVYDSENLDFTISKLRWAIGIGIKIGKFRIDGKFDKNFIKRGPYIIGGEKTGFAYLTILYSFGDEE
ncbi:MAG: hypothetical protein ABIM60_01280 [candidate division WOR-3 bacterium]